LFNARSLKNKLPALHYMLNCDRCPLIFVTESWLNEVITDGMIDPTGSYNVYRRDRPIRPGGGVLALVSKQFQSYKVVIPDTFKLVEIVATVIITDAGSFRFIVVYRPPEYNALGREYMKVLCDCLSYLCNTSDTIVIVGDFNLPCIDWSSAYAPDDMIHSDFLKFCSKNGFANFVDSPTRNANCIDLVLSNDQQLISSICTTSPFCTSDHFMVNFSVILKPHDQAMAGTARYDFEHADYDAIQADLFSHPFHFNVFPSGSSEEIWSQFITPIMKAIDKHVPLKKGHYSKSVKAGSKKYPRHITRAFNKKKNLWRAYHSVESVANKAAYYQQVEICRKLLFDFEKSKELSVIGKANLGSFYRFINKKLSCKSGVGPIKLPSGEVIVDDETKATVLNDYFGSVFTVDNGILPTFSRRVPESCVFDNIVFSPEIILKTLSHGKQGRSPGPEGIPQLFLNKTKHSLAVPLTALYQHIFSSGILPDSWRLANVIPVFKKGASSDVSNYRPISLTSIFCKTMERIVKDQMLTHLEANKLITRHQHGFLSNHSTCSQLLETINDWTLAIRNRHNVDAIYFDFAKAFDTVSHAKLIHKLSAYGFSGALLTFITDFLTGRTQHVVLPNGSSSFLHVLSGVPQGSVLGPLLFLLFVNDVADFFSDKVSIKLFADDIKIYLEISHESDVDALQVSIDLIARWASTWQLRLASHKCHHLHIGLAKSLAHSSYKLGDTSLPTLASCCDLGVHVDSRLSFVEHINTTVAKAHLRANQILRCFLSKDPSTLTMAFKTYVRPLVEYCSPIWSPCSIGLIRKIESVQRYFTKRLKGLGAMTYDQRLANLGLERLELRRLRFDLVTCYNILHNHLSVPPDIFFSLANHTRTRGHSYKLLIPDSRISCRHNFFSVRLIETWNSLPDEVVSAGHTYAFKARLKLVNLDSFLSGTL
jgi:hypothetical protein